MQFYFGSPHAFLLECRIRLGVTFRTQNLGFRVLLTFCHRKIVGCDFQYNYKLNNTDLMTLKLDNVDIFQCASECLDDESCQNGWVHFSGNNEVGSTTQIDELLLL